MTVPDMEKYEKKYKKKNNIMGTVFYKSTTYAVYCDSMDNYKRMVLCSVRNR